MAGKFLVFRSASFCPCFHATCYALIPDMQNFVPRIPTADPAWSPNRALDHASKVDIKFDHVSIVDTSGPRSKTRDWCHKCTEELSLSSDGHISAQEIHLLAKKARLADCK